MSNVISLASHHVWKTCSIADCTWESWVSLIEPAPKCIRHRDGTTVIRTIKK